jgi:hypothetical protein
MHDLQGGREGGRGAGLHYTRANQYGMWVTAHLNGAAQDLLWFCPVVAAKQRCSCLSWFWRFWIICQAKLYGTGPVLPVNKSGCSLPAGFMGERDEGLLSKCICSVYVCVCVCVVSSTPGIVARSYIALREVQLGQGVTRRFAQRFKVVH